MKLEPFFIRVKCPYENCKHLNRIKVPDNVYGKDQKTFWLIDTKCKKCNRRIALDIEAKAMKIREGFPK